MSTVDGRGLCVVCAEVTMEERQELLEHWKWIVRAVFQAEYNLGQRGERINKEAEDKDKEADRWVNKKAHFVAHSFQDFEPRKGFRCAEYFKLYN